MSLQAAVGSLTYEGAADILADRVVLFAATAKLHLYKSSFTPNVNSVEADFEAAEADFTGYAAVTLTWGTAGRDANGNAISVSSRALFQATAGTPANTIGGCWLEYQTAPGPPAVHHTVDYFPIDPQITVNVTGATIAVTVTVSEPAADYVVVEN